MSEEKKVKDMIDESENLTEFAKKLRDSDIEGMPKSSGGYVSVESVERAVRTLERRAAEGEKVKDLMNHHKQEFRAFTRQEDIRKKAKELHNKIAEESQD